MNCNEVRTLIDEYAAGALGTDPARAVRAHLAECPRCREALREEEHLRRALAGLPAVAAPDDFEDRLRRRLSGVMPAAVPASPDRTALPWRTALLVAASLLLAIGLFWMIRPAGLPSGSGVPAVAERSGAAAPGEMVIPLPVDARNSAAGDSVRFVTKDVGTGNDMYVEMPARYNVSDLRQMDSYYLQEVSH
jgi:anti-sigma factor (TIGR02949 family)